MLLRVDDVVQAVRREKEGGGAGQIAGQQGGEMEG